MTTQAPNKTEKFILNEVDSAPNKAVRPELIRRAANLTLVGFRRVLDRMIERNWLGRTPHGEITLTFGGMQAMRAAGMELQ